jgi:AcrR family transcriptional regulator
MAEVADAARVSRATVFNYFASKYALVEAITDEVLVYFRGMLEEALADEVTPTPTLIRTAFSHMGSGIEAWAGFFRGIFREVMKISVGLDEGGVAERTNEVNRDLLERLMERGLARGDLLRTAPAPDLARAFSSLANGTIVTWLYEERSDSLRERMERAAEIFLGAVAAPRFAERPRRLRPLSNPPRPRSGRAKEKR